MMTGSASLPEPTVLPAGPASTGSIDKAPQTQSLPEERADAAARGVVVITGASGLIGLRLAKHLSQHYDLVGLDVKPPGEQLPALDFIKADLTDDDSVAAALAELKSSHGENITSVIHLAAYYDFSGESSPLYEELTVQGTRRLLQQLHAQRFDVEQFVFSSSLLVMKPDEEGRRISELSETEAEWDYPQSKLRAEQVITDERAHIPAVILRIAGVYDQQCHSLPISQQIARIYEKQLESHVFPGNKTHGQALVHLDDLAECVQLVIQKRDALGAQSLFLIAEPDVMSYEELQDRLGELIHGIEWTTIRIPKAVAKAGAWVQGKLSDEKTFIKPWMIELADDHYAATIAHAQEKLGWNPQHRLRDTLPAIVEFLKRSPERFYRVNNLPLPEELAKNTGSG